MPLVELTVNIPLRADEVDHVQREIVRVVAVVMGAGSAGCQGLVQHGALLAHAGDGRSPCANWRVSAASLSREDLLVRCVPCAAARSHALALPPTTDRWPSSRPSRCAWVWPPAARSCC